MGRYASPTPYRGIVIMLVVFGLPGLALVTGFQSAPGQVFAGDRTTNALIGVAFFAIAIFAIRAILLKATLRIDEHANGLHWTERGVRRTVLWQEIAELRGARVKHTVRAIEVARTVVVRLRLENGHELVLSSMLAGANRLIDRLEHEVGERCLTRARATLADGGIAMFGPVSLTNEELRLTERDRAIPWTSLQEVGLANGVLSFRGEDAAPIEVEWSKVSNAKALLVLVEERVSARTAEVQTAHS